MEKRNRWAMFIAMAALPLWSAAGKTDSLWSIWKDAAKPDSVRLQALGRTAWALMPSDPDSALSLALLLYDEASAREDRSNRILALNHQGVAYSIIGNYYAAHVAYEQMLEMGTEAGDKKTVAGAHINLGAIHQEQGNTGKALEHYRQSLSVFEALNDERSLTSVYNNIAGIYHALGDTAAALGYTRKCMDIYRKQGDDRAFSTAKGNLGLVYMEQGLHARAAAELRSALAMKRSIGDRAGEAKVLADIGELHRRTGQLDSALVSLRQSRELREALRDEQGLVTTFTTTGFVLIDAGRAKEAAEQCAKADAIAKDLGLRSQERSACDCLYRSSKALGRNDDALRYHERLTALTDSLRADDLEQQLDQMEFKRQLMSDSLRNVEAALREQLAGGDGTSGRKPWLIGGGLAAVVAAAMAARRRRREKRS
ncbi:MAG: tetratricopeptide repeat protein [Flavobacteriales bacterium]|nr:MAG: tetratricopeptide repeat protein [Flavobacteriales bacterium]